METPYIVYLNKAYDVYAMDAYAWAKKNNITLPEDSYNYVISEKIFWFLLEEGHLDGKPVYFCKDKLVSANP